MTDSYKINLSEQELPQQWYNVQPDLPRPLPPFLHPATGQPVTPEDMLPIFPMELIMQEMSQERWIEIPDDVREIYRLWRPSPLHRARRLEKHLKTPARIYFKNESVSPAGSHKPNTAVPQAYYNKVAGVKRLATETGAGQWGSTDRTDAGRAILAKYPDSPGSLGMAISEAVEDAAKHEDTKYSLGSVLNHVLLHQTVVGLETKKQLQLEGDKADILIGCVGGGSNFAGFVFPFVPDKLKGDPIRFVAVEPTSCPTFTKGAYTYDFGDTAGLTPMMLMYTLGHSFVPPGIHAGGLRYHGDAPLLSLLVHEKVIEARAYPQNPVFQAAITFARTEGIVPAPETSHALRAGIDEALKCKETGEEKCIVIAFSGHGFLDLAAYDNFLEGKLEDFEYPDSLIQEAICAIPKFPG